MATSTMVPLEVYLHTTYRPDCDWIDGEVKERNMGEGQHAAIQGFFAYIFRLHAKDWQVRAYPELRTRVSPTRFRIPDISVLRATAPFERIVTTPPMLCIEIFSRDDRMSDMQERVTDYLAMGVETVWLVDPWKKAAFVVDVNGTHKAPIHLTVAATPIQIALADVFAESDLFGEE